MAEEIAPKTDVVIDAGITPKSENLPVQVTPIRLTKDNYLSWSAALEIGITSRGRLPYITGDKPAPSKTDPQWANWALEDSQVKVWIISSVSADIQPLILRKPTSFEMWNVLARMYGRKKRVLRAYQIKRSIYALKQGDLSVASYYAALKTKWEELDYHVKDNWDCGSDHARHWEMEWMDRTFLFLGGLRDEFETIRSQILNCDDIPGIEDVYAHVESEEQRRQIMQIDPSRGSGPSAFVSRSSVPSQHPARRCTHCHKLGHSADFCWDLHPEKRLVRGRPPSSRRGPLVQESNQGGSSSNEKSRLSQDQIKELQAYIGRLSTTPEDTSTSDGAKLAQALVATILKARAGDVVRSGLRVLFAQCTLDRFANTSWLVRIVLILPSMLPRHCSIVWDVPSRDSTTAMVSQMVTMSANILGSNNLEANHALEISKKEKDDLLLKLSQAERMLMEGKNMFKALEEDNLKLRRALEQSMTRINRMSVDSDYYVDRRIVIKLLVTYLERNHSKEVLDLMVRMLGFSDEDKKRIGFLLAGGKGVARGVWGLPGRLVGGILGGNSAAPVHVPSDNQISGLISFLKKLKNGREGLQKKLVQVQKALGKISEFRPKCGIVQKKGTQ
ncbi:Golgin candidate 3 [Nymphaea thermarum]|nr:Golgin candidate 3 [Nymphaea thermarum]